MADPLVSICMPAYNAELFIGEAVNSIINQSYKNWELIVVNDGSTDDTANQLDQIKDPRIKVYHQSNKGQCAAANAAYTFSNGRLIKFMDADDLLSSNFLENQVKTINNQDNVIASAPWGRFYNNDLQSFKIQNIPTKTCEPIEWLAAEMTNKQPMLQCAMFLIPRKILNVSGLWNEDLSLINDFEFFIRVLLHTNEIRYTPGAVLYYRSGIHNSLSGLKSRKGAQSAFNSTLLGTNHLIEFENSERIKKIAANSFQYFIYDFYPDHLDLIKKSEDKIKEYGGSDVPFIAGGLTKCMSTFIGWKATKKIKKLIKNIYP
nr:glycosyltransferase family A protein [Mucilaginibacter sp. L294]